MRKVTIFNEENQYADVETTDTNVYTIKGIAPLCIKNRKNEEGINVATLTILAADTNDNVFTLNRNYILDNPTDEETIKKIDFHLDNMFINMKSVNSLLLTTVPCYMTDLEFDIHSFDDNEACICVLDAATKTKKTYSMNPEIFTALTFIDSYIVNGEAATDTTKRDLSIMSTSAVKPGDAYMYPVDMVVGVQGIANTIPEKPEKKKSLFGLKKNSTDDVADNTCIAVAFKVKRMPTTDDSIIEDCSILTTFDIGLKFTEDKYKGNTVESLQETYYGEDNQFVSTTLIENASIQNSGRKFMLIRARNEAGDIRVFLLGNDVIKELINMIKNY